MSRNLRSLSFVAAIAGVVLPLTHGVANAQSGTTGGSNPSARQSPPPGSGTASDTKKAPAGLQGYCPVCIVELKQWMKGSPQFSVVHDGVTYYFPGEEQKQAFLQAPAKYAPALGGDDIVTYAQTSKRVNGSLSHAVLHDGRLYLFANAQNKQRFHSQPQVFANADVALNGECPVCRVELRQRVAGKPELTAMHDGLRYFFPGEAQKEKFLQRPAAYVQAALRDASGGAAPAGSGAQAPTSAGSGTR